ncbi:uncharacterized protein N7515_001811 [Penicillium bovifimosum]|uniref:Uncharacterized protein n=1 Tax=Penicillium bovifimosum TaxID=126998 RepID=A0A9W9L924_9EURO|nr:uncharacterized protein N7515_001811 [Penicillium bovifimosum]KAJ5143024.1 hypothetical protein N7515_001811 [Penicillium bovifimosum]
MRPDAISAITAFLAVGGLQLVAAQDAPEAHVERPRYYFPRDVKRTVRNARRDADFDPASFLNGVLDKFDSTKGSFGGPAPTSNSESSTAAAPQKGQEVVVVTISVDPKNPEITHRITGTTTIGGEPTATLTQTTQKTEGASTVNTNKGSEAASADAGSTSKDKPVDSSVKVPTTPASTTTSSKNILGDLGSDLGAIFKGDSTTASTSTGTPTSASAAKVSSPASTESSTSSNNGLLDGLGSGLSGLFSHSTTSSSASAASTGASSVNTQISSPSTTTTSSGTTASQATIPVSVPASATSPASTAATATASSTSGDLFDGIKSGVDSLLGISTGTSTGSSALIPTAKLPNGSLLPSKSTGLIPTNPGAIPTPTNSLGLVPVPHSPGSDSTSTSTSGSDSASSSHDMPKVPTPTSRPASVPLSATTTEVSSTKTLDHPTETKSPTTSDDNNWMPSTILIMPTVTATETSTSGETEQPKPTALPGSITPSNDVSEAPADSVLLQLGFNNQLPWSFVATTPLSSSQIFNYTPQAIGFALPTLSAKESPVMFALEPYYNWQATGYNATLAIFYFPRDKVDALRALKINPNSALYNQKSESIQSLMSMVDSTIPLEFSGNYPSGKTDSTDGHGDGGSTDDSDGGNNNNGDGSAGSSKAKASSVGIGVGVVAGAAAYGAGMFWVARRYRKRKQLHQRSSSTVEQMSQGGSAAGSLFAAGGRAPSHGSRGTARSQMISAPVMAENSLGWN